MENTTYNNIEKITDEAPRNIEHKELETLIIASIETLKQQKMKCGIDEVRKLVQDSLEENISLESFEKTLQHLIDNDSVKSNSVSNRVCFSIPKNNTCRDAFNIKEELQSFKNELVEEFKCPTQVFFAEINLQKSDVLTRKALTDEYSSYISSLTGEEIEYLREENTLVTYNDNSTDKTTQNSDSVIDKTIQNNNKEPFKNKKNSNKNLANTKTLSTNDNFTSMCFEHLKNEKNVSANRKNTPEANKKKKQKKNKEDNYKETTYRNNSYKNRNNKNKMNVYILGNSMVKKLNGYPLTRKIKHKNLKRCSFSGAKISCLMDHVYS